jgi:hypothetical protein
MTSVMAPGYVHEVVPVPQAAQGVVVHDGDVKKFLQAPATQTWLVLQLLPHMPQFCGSFCSCAAVKHPPLQFRRGGMRAPQNVSWHMPSTQCGFMPVHWVPHAPQLFASCSKSVHALLHVVRPGRQAHADAVQY